MHNLFAEDTQNSMCYIHYEWEDEEITVGLQRVQRHNAIKVGHAYVIMENIHLQE